jgi:hypothetical protein
MNAGTLTIPTSNIEVRITSGNSQKSSRLTIRSLACACGWGSGRNQGA